MVRSGRGLWCDSEMVRRCENDGGVVERERDLTTMERDLTTMEYIAQVEGTDGHDASMSYISIVLFKSII